jgi:hypothetical protein
MAVNKFYWKYRISENIKAFLKKHPKVNYLQRVLRHCNDSTFIKQVMTLGHDPNCFYLHCNGDKNPDKNILFIEVTGGMGVMYRYMLYALWEAERLGFVPVIKFHDDCVYREDHSVDGTDNAFEYYFKQPSAVSLADAGESKRVFLLGLPHLSRIESDLGNLNPDVPLGYVVNEEYLAVLAEVARKYLHLNDKTRRFFESSFQNLFPPKQARRKILGVHIRGTDFALQWEGHPNMVMVEDFFSAIDEVLGKESGFDHIFLATDDNTRLEAFKKRYGDQLSYYEDVHRGEGVRLAIMDALDRENTHYLDGLEALRDMYTLSECDGLIAGLSQISISARIRRLADYGPFEYMKILDKGLYRS